MTAWGQAGWVQNSYLLEQAMWQAACKPVSSEHGKHMKACRDADQRALCEENILRTSLIWSSLSHVSSS